MRRFVTVWIGCLAATSAARADIKADRDAGIQLYQRIVTQNPFRLGTLSPPQAAPEPVVSNSFADVKLTGISASAGHKSAYLLWEERGRPPHYFSLAEGQREGAWEMVAIDAINETVRLRRQGIERVLSLKTNGVKPGAQIAPENRKFVDEHTRAHQLHQLREQERIQRERAEAEQLLHQQRILSATFSPDGHRIVTPTPDGTARIWDVRTGMPIDAGAGEPSGVNP